MRPLSDAHLLDLWDTGRTRHPIDRSLLLCAWARPELAPDGLAQLPLGTVNATLLQWRAMLFGPQVALQLACSSCGETLAVPLSTDQLLAGARVPEPGTAIDVHGCLFRLPDSQDLAAVATEPDASRAAMVLLERCCLQRSGTATPLPALLADAERQLDAADPLADLRLDATCHACGEHTDAAIDAGALLWNDIQHHARELLEQVHLLARCYGWNERDVLALRPGRRAAYLELATA